MTQHPVTAVGAVLVNEQLTVVVRRGDMLEEPMPFAIHTSLEAAVMLLKQRGPGGGIIYIEASGMASQALEAIRAKYSGSHDEIVNGMSPPLSVAEGNVLFANRRSELFYKFRKLVVDEKLLVPVVYTEQLAAFAESELNGKIFYPNPDEIAGKLGKYPTLALAAVLAAIETPKYGAGKTKSPAGHDPFAVLFGKR
jgi:hypothetical protein